MKFKKKKKNPKLRKTRYEKKTMKYHNFILKGTKKTIIEQIKQCLQQYDIKHRKDIINGCYKKIPKFNLLQIIILTLHSDSNSSFSFNEKHDALMYLLKQGGNLNVKGTNGINCFHLLLLMFFYCPSFCCEETINLFINMLNLNFIPCNIAILSFDKMFSTLDLLYLLQNYPTKKKLVSSTFFPKKYNIYVTNFKKLDEKFYNKLYVFLLMHNEKFFYIKNAYHPFHNYNVFNIPTAWNSEYKSVLLEYLYHKYNLPPLSSQEKDDSCTIENDISYLRNHNVLIDDVYRILSNNNNIPIGADSHSSNNVCYVNQEFIDNNQLQLSSFFDSIDNYAFHHTYLGENIKTGLNPFTRRKIDPSVLDQWIHKFNQNSNNFPLTTIHDSIGHFPYLFDSVYVNQPSDKYKVKSLIDYIEKYFYINHPYNNIYRLETMKSYEIAYISHILIKDTSLFPRFQKVTNRPDILNLLQILLYYCKTKYRYINVIYFFIEEIFADLSSFNNIENLLSNVSSNTYEIMINYTIRYNTSNIVFFNKFLSNMLKINEFKQKYSK